VSACNYFFLSGLEDGITMLHQHLKLVLLFLFLIFFEQLGFGVSTTFVLGVGFLLICSSVVITEGS
jgi:hypothetical protein